MTSLPISQVAVKTGISYIVLGLIFFAAKNLGDPKPHLILKATDEMI